MIFDKIIKKRSFLSFSVKMRKRSFQKASPSPLAKLKGFLTRMCEKSKIAIFQEKALFLKFEAQVLKNEHFRRKC